MRRPTVVTVFGVLNIVFGALGVLSSVIALGVLIAVGNGAMDRRLALGDSAVYNTWVLIATVLGSVFVVVLLASGIGLLRMRPWGRTGSLAYAAYAVLSGIVGMALNWVYLVQPVLARQQDGEDPALVFGAVFGMIGGCAGFIYPILLWYYLTRPAVIAAFAGDFPAADEAQFPLTAALEPDIARDPANPYLAPRTDSVPLGATTPGDSIVETFVPSKNAPALWSYYLGLFSLFPCFGFFLGMVAVYLGIKGLRLVRANPEVCGGVHAWVGIVCGGLFGFFNFLLLVFFMIGVAVAINERR